jgi:hypothetical protein
MTPPISKDWWLAAALSTATVPATLAQNPAGSAAGSGVVTAVAPGGQVTGNNEVMVVGSSIVPGQRLRTNAAGVLHVLFLDQSALTLGPDSELSIDEFTFDPASRQGRIRLGLVKGTLRVVGGQISKNTATEIKTPHGTVDILGGITIVETNGQSTSGTFLFGQSMRATDNSGNTQTITRAGFGVDIGSGSVSEPRRIPTNQLNELLARLESKLGTGNPNPSPAPAGQLLSTGNAGGTTAPGSGLANDRLKNVVDTNTGNNPSRTLKDLLGTGQMLNQS